MMPKLEGKRWPSVFEIPGIEGATDETPEQRLSRPCSARFLDNQGNLEGVLAQLGRVNDDEFSRRGDRRFMAHIVRKVEYVIEQIVRCNDRVS